MFEEFKQYGDDIFIDKNVNITRPNLVSIGNHVAIDYGFHCTTSMDIGNYVHIGPHVTFIRVPYTIRIKGKTNNKTHYNGTIF